MGRLLLALFIDGFLRRVPLPLPESQSTVPHRKHSTRAWLSTWSRLNVTGCRHYGQGASSRSAVISFAFAMVSSYLLIELLDGSTTVSRELAPLNILPQCGSRHLGGPSAAAPPGRLF